MNRVALAVILLLAAAVPAAGRPRSATSPKAARVQQIDDAVTVVVKRVARLPADAAGTEQLAQSLERIGAQAQAALTPDLRGVALYESVAQDVAKLPALAAAVRASWPCREATKQIADANAATRVATADEITRARTACEAYERTARMTKLAGEARATVRDLDREIRGVQRTSQTIQQRAAIERNAARRAAEQATTVMGTFLDVTLADAEDPAKIAAAFERAPADLIYSAPKGRLALQSIGGVTSRCQTGDRAKIGTAWYHNGEASSIEIQDANVDDTIDVPLLIWMREGDDALVVSIDGLRYRTTMKELMKGIPPRSAWPTAARLVCLTDENVKDMTEAGMLDAAVLARATKARLAVEACVMRTWKSGEREFAANDTANITQSTRANRYSALLDRYTRRVEQSCAPQGRAYEAAMVAVMKSFAAPRNAPLAAATAALAAK